MGEDRIISALIGLVGACNNNPKTAGTDSLVVKALAFPVLCPEYDEKAFRKMIDDIYLEKSSVAPDCAVCAAPCGNTSDYDMDEADMHKDFMKGKITLIGCPKLDAVDYSEKLTEIIRNNNIKSVTVLRMEVPCCGGLELAVKKALQESGKFIPWQTITVSIDGKILDD